MSAENPEAALAADPGASPEELYELAAQHPDLRPIIAENPSAYPGLLAWLATLGDPAVVAALERRGSGEQPAPASEAGAPAEPAGAEPSPELTELIFGGEETVIAPAEPAGGKEGGFPRSPAGPGIPAVEETIAWATAERPAQPGGPAPAPFLGPAAQAPHYGATPYGPPAAYAGGPGVPPGQPPAQAAGAAPAGGSGSRWKLPLFILLGVLVALAVAAVVLLSISLGKKPGETVIIEDKSGGQTSVEEWETSSPTATPAPAPTRTQAPAPAPSPTATLAPATPQPPAASYPAPSGSVSATWFVSPTQNIACQMTDDYAECTIHEHYYEGRGYSACPFGATTIRVTRSGSADLVCDGFIVPNTGSEGVLVYDTSSAYGDFACSSFESGMTCWNTQTGNSFALAREGWMRGSNGRIMPSQFAW